MLYIYCKIKLFHKSYFSVMTAVRLGLGSRRMKETLVPKVGTHCLYSPPSSEHLIVPTIHCSNTFQEAGT